MKIVVLVFSIALISCKNERDQLTKKQTELHAAITRVDKLVAFYEAELSKVAADSNSQLVLHNVAKTKDPNAPAPVINKAMSESYQRMLKYWNDSLNVYLREFEKNQDLLEKMK